MGGQGNEQNFSGYTVLHGSLNKNVSGRSSPPPNSKKKCTSTQTDVSPCLSHSFLPTLDWCWHQPIRYCTEASKLRLVANVVNKF